MRTPRTLTDSFLDIYRTIVSTHPPPFVGSTPRYDAPTLSHRSEDGDGVGGERGRESLERASVALG